MLFVHSKQISRHYENKLNNKEKEKWKIHTEGIDLETCVDLCNIYVKWPKYYQF